MLWEMNQPRYGKYIDQKWKLRNLKVHTRYRLCRPCVTRLRLPISRIIIFWVLCIELILIIHEILFCWIVWYVEHFVCIECSLYVFIYISVNYTISFSSMLFVVEGFFCAVPFLLNLASFVWILLANDVIPWSHYSKAKFEHQNHSSEVQFLTVLYQPIIAMITLFIQITITLGRINAQKIVRPANHYPFNQSDYWMVLTF